jgi:hypothetical protein
MTFKDVLKELPGSAVIKRGLLLTTVFLAVKLSVKFFHPVGWSSTRRPVK